MLGYVCQKKFKFKIKPRRRIHRCGPSTCGGRGTRSSGCVRGSKRRTCGSGGRRATTHAVAQWRCARMRLVPAPRARILQVGCWRLLGGAPRHPPEARAGSYHPAARSGASCSAEADLQSDAVGCRSSTRPAMRRLWHISRRQREWASRAECGCCSAPCTVTARGDAGRSVPLRQGGPCAAGVRTAQHMRCRLPSRTPHRRRVCARHSTRWFLC